MTGTTQGFQPADVGSDESVRVSVALPDDVPRRFQTQARPIDAAIGFRHNPDRYRVERDDMAAAHLVQLGGVRRLDIVGAPIYPVDHQMQTVARPRSIRETGWIQRQAGHSKQGVPAAGFGGGPP